MVPYKLSLWGYEPPRIPVRSCRTIPLSQTSTLIESDHFTTIKKRCNVDAQVLENVRNQIEDAAKNLVKALNNGVEGGIDVFKDRTDDRNLGENTLNRRKERVQVFNDSHQTF